MDAAGSGAQRGGQVLVLLLIVAAIIAGGCVLLFWSRDSRAKDAERFAREAAERLVLRQDAKFLDRTLAPRAEVLFPPSWRERFFGYVRALGPVQPDFDLTGRVLFTSHFFAPVANFQAKFKTPNGPSILELHFSHGGVRWEIDALNLTWNPPPTPTPAAVPSPTPAATATPTPTATPKRRKRK